MSSNDQNQPKRDRASEVPRTLVEALAQLVPIGSSLVTLYRMTHPTSWDISQEKFHEDTADRLEKIEQQLAVTANAAVSGYLHQLVSEDITNATEVLRKRRFYADCKLRDEAVHLATHLVVNGVETNASDAAARAFAWCARVLATNAETNSLANDCLGYSKQTDMEEHVVASALILSGGGDLAGALGILSSLDTPMARTAALAAVRSQRGQSEALEWMKKASRSSLDLDADGKFLLLSYQLEEAHWDEAESTATSISEDDFSDTPALLQLCALALSLSTMPMELRSVLLHNPPFELMNVPLASDIKAIAARRRAGALYKEAAEKARQLECHESAEVYEDYGLWIEFNDPTTAEQAKEKLTEKLRGAEPALRLVPMAVQQGVSIDTESVEKEINRVSAIAGGPTRESSLARLAVAFLQRKPELVATYIDKHYDDMAPHLNEDFLRSTLAEALCHSGSVGRAREVIANISQDGAALAAVDRLERLIAEKEGADTIEVRKAQFEKSDSLSDLVELIRSLSGSVGRAELCQYTEELFKRTRSQQDAEQHCQALSQSGFYTDVLNFLEENTEFLEQSGLIRLSYAWALYYQGDLLESLALLSGLPSNVQNRDYRSLYVNLKIATGDWQSLAAFVGSELEARHDRQADELIGAAQLAANIGSPHTADLVSAAVEKSEDDPSILTEAYFLASRIGTEAIGDAHEWLKKASELSGDDGPVRQVSLRELVDAQPDWNKRVRSVSEKLVSAQVPIFVSANAINRSLSEQVAFPAVLNPREVDPRRRVAIPAFSGARTKQKGEMGEDVGIDPIAIFTLGLLELLPKFVESNRTVYVAHGLMAWLFGEKQRVAFHQPSRIREAHQLRDVIARGKARKLVASGPIDGELATQVGTDLASLISEASKQTGVSDAQHIVIIPGPVHRVSTLLEEEADLGHHASLVAGCIDLLEALRSRGVVTADEFRRASTYLGLQERRWPQPANIDDSAWLYLDASAVRHFQNLGLLDKIVDADFELILPTESINEADGLIAYERHSKRVETLLDSIRKTLSDGILSGSVKSARAPEPYSDDGTAWMTSPAATSIKLADVCSLVVFDDRFMNTHAFCGGEQRQVALWCTLDILSSLARTGKISIQEAWEYLTRLRQSGYLFVPIQCDELLAYLNDAQVSDQSLVETAELKAIRENLLLAQMDDWLQLPQEVSWFSDMRSGLLDAFEATWSSDLDLETIHARADWIVRVLDIRSWIHRFQPSNRRDVGTTMPALDALRLLNAPTGVSVERRKECQLWSSQTILEPMRQEHPDQYKWLVEWSMQEVREIAERDFDKGDGIDG